MSLGRSNGRGKPSAPAVICALVRAAHLLWDQPPKIFEDTLALELSGCESEAALKAQMDRLEAEVARTTNPDFALAMRRSVTAAVVTRSRYLEDEVGLGQAVRRGVSQYVIPWCRAVFFRVPPTGTCEFSAYLRSRSSCHASVEAGSSSRGRCRVAG